MLAVTCGKFLSPVSGSTPERTDVCGEIFVEKIGIPPEAEIGVL